MTTIPITDPIRVTAVLTRVALALGAAAAVAADHLLADPTPILAALVALGLLLGVPHGAIDHHVAAQVLGVRAFTAAAGYAALAAAAWAILHWGGPVPLAFMIVASVVHFGLGEVETTGIPLSSSPIQRAAMVLTGAGCLILPLARGGADWDETLRTLSPSLADLSGDGVVRAALIGGWAASAALTTVLLVRDRQWPAVLDVVIIGAVGSIVTPLTAFALWFGLWHGPRHIARLVSLETTGRSGTLSARTAFISIARRAAPATLGAFLTLVVVVGVVVGDGSTTGAVAAAIVVLLALTAPHMAVVAALDVVGSRSGHSVVPAMQRERDHEKRAAA